MPTHTVRLIATINKQLELNGMMRKELSDRLGWSPQVVSNLLNNKRKMYADEIVPICKALGIPLDVLFNHTNL